MIPNGFAVPAPTRFPYTPRRRGRWRAHMRGWLRRLKKLG